jgi:hypothetical protein
MKETDKYLRSANRVKDMGAPDSTVGNVSDPKVVGWISLNKRTNNSCSVFVRNEHGEQVYKGFISLSTVERLMDGKLQHIPIKAFEEVSNERTEDESSRDRY